MLVLTRKVGQTIVIGDVEIVVKSVVGTRVEIGIAAPESREIRRGELAEKCKAG